jgi:hypothetical protein
MTQVGQDGHLAKRFRVEFAVDGLSFPAQAGVREDDKWRRRFALKMGRPFCCLN